MTSKKAQYPAWDKAVMIPIGDLVLAPYNPNQMAEEEFALLLEQIEKDGFDEPLLVCPEGDKFVVIAGNHRLRACRGLGHGVVPCIIKSWTEIERRVNIVRRNTVRGSSNREKFTDNVDFIIKNDECEIMAVAEAMGYIKEKSFFNMYIKEDEEIKKAVKERDKEEKEMEKVIKSYENVIRNIMETYGDTIPNNFLHFFYGDNQILLVKVDDRLNLLINKVADKAKTDNIDLSSFFYDMLKSSVKEV